MNTQSPLMKSAKITLGLYLGLTLAAGAWFGVVIWALGPAGLKFVIVSGPGSHTKNTMFYVGVCWLLFGSILTLWRLGAVTRKNLVGYACFYFVAFLYLSLLRERIYYGDLWAYVTAGMALYGHQPLNATYLYPPLLATCLQALGPFGPTVMAWAVLGGNYLALLLFYCLLVQVLRRCGFERNGAALTVLLALILNVPVLRTLFYGQINLEVANLILLSLLLVRRRVWMSALALSLGVHLKIMPAIFILPFLLTRNWRWLGWFGLLTLAIVGLTSWANDFSYYGASLDNLRHYARTTNDFDYRDSSLDALVGQTSMVWGRLFHLRIVHERAIVLALKGAVLLAGLGLTLRLARRNVLCLDPALADYRLYNCFMVLSILMLLPSPLLWDYHGAFLVLPFLLLLKSVVTAGEATLFAVAGSLLFLVPAFDCYPLSFHRLLGILLGGVLVTRLAYRRNCQTGPALAWINRVGRALTGEPAATEAPAQDSAMQ